MDLYLRKVSFVWWYGEGEHEAILSRVAGLMRSNHLPRGSGNGGYIKMDLPWLSRTVATVLDFRFNPERIRIMDGAFVLDGGLTY